MGSGFSRHPRTPLPERTARDRMPSSGDRSDESVPPLADSRQPKLNEGDKKEVSNTLELVTKIRQEDEVKMNYGRGDVDIDGKDQHPPPSHLVPKRARVRFDEDESESESGGGGENLYPRIDTPTFKRKDVRAHSSQNADTNCDLEHRSRPSFWPQDQLDLTLGDIDMEQGMDWAELQRFRKCTTLTLEDVRRDMEARHKWESASVCVVEERPPTPPVSSRFAILQVCGLLLYIVAICVVIMYALTR